MVSATLLFKLNAEKVTIICNILEKKWKFQCFTIRQNKLDYYSLMLWSIDSKKVFSLMNIIKKYGGKIFSYELKGEANYGQRMQHMHLKP